MKKAIIVVSYGTTKDQAREKSIEPFYQMFKEAYPQIKVVQAYTSRYVRKKMLEKGQAMYSPKEAMEAMIDQGYEAIYLQPSHILPGHEYHRIVEAMEVVGKEHGNIQLHIGKALLCPENDMQNIIDILKEAYGFNRENTSYVLLGHGTDHLAHQQYAMLESIARSNHYPILVGTIEDGVEEVLKRLKGLPRNRVELIPLLFVAGDHVMNDMMGENDSWMGAIQTQGFDVECHPVGLGEIDAIRNYYLNQFENNFSLKETNKNQ